MYDNNITSNNTSNNTNNNTSKECIICWELSGKYTPVKRMKEYSYINNCNCNAFFHDNCLKIWLLKKSSCPICRKKIYINNDKNDDIYTKIKTYTGMFLIRTCKVVKLVSLIYLVNIIFITVYVIVFFDINLYSYEDDCKEYN